ncbi:heparinase II/III family protein [Bacteroidota bacterium]
MKNQSSFGFLFFLSSIFLIQYGQPVISQSLNDHPRLIITNDIVQYINTKGNPANELRGIFLETCDEMLEMECPEYLLEGRRLLGVSRTYLKRISYLSLAYRLTGKMEYLWKSEELMLASAEFPNWNPSHFLDVAEMTMALAIGYDWLFDELSPDKRRQILDAIIEMGLKPSADQDHFWINARHNWNQVCHAGMAFGAWAVYEDAPELAKEIISRAEENIRIPEREYLPDGVYFEGPSYWTYGTSFNALFISAWEGIHRDKTYDMNEGFLNSGSYFLHVHGPAGSYNYSDGRSGFGLSPAAFWFAQKTMNPELLFYQAKDIEDLKDGNRQISPRGLGDRLFPFILIWLSDTDKKPDPPSELVWTGHGEQPLSLNRSSWSEDAIYLGIKGGSPSLNHAHMDVGSFIMDALGERWAIDLGSHDYNSLESQGIEIWDSEQNGERWSVFRYTNYSHNTLVIDDKYQQVDSHAPIVESFSSPEKKGAIIDISEAYSASVEEVLRSAFIINNSYVVVQDKIRNNKKKSSVRWAMVVPDNVSVINSRTAVIEKNGKHSTFHIRAPENSEIKLYTTTPGNDFEDDNPGTVLLGFETQFQRYEEILLEVLLVPGKITAEELIELFE